MTPEQPEEEARRDECVRIVEELAQRHMRSQRGNAPITRRLDVESTIGQRILAAAKPPEPPSPWPVVQEWVDPDPPNAMHTIAEFHWESPSVLRVIRARGIVENWTLETGWGESLRNALVADASDAEKDALLVALCKEHGIDLKRVANFIYNNPTEETTICDIHNAIWAVLDNAAKQEAEP